MSMHAVSHFVVLLGASGSGKTTLASAIEQRYRGDVDVFYFDRIGVPPPQQMIAEHGSGEGWQRAQTIAWMARLAPLARAGRRLLFEGQTRLAYLREGAKLAGDPSYVPILIDCDDATRTRRLSLERNQPELADETMMAWARHLRDEARRLHCQIMDTSTRSLDASVGEVAARLGLAAPSR